MTRRRNVTKFSYEKCVSLYPHTRTLSHKILRRNVTRKVLIRKYTRGLENGNKTDHYLGGRSQWPRGLRRRSAAARLLRSWVRIPQWHGCFSVVSVVCCQVEVSANELITCPEESYRLWCVVVCNLETSRMRRPWPALGRSATAKKNYRGKS